MWNIEFESPENIPKFKGKHYLTSKFRVEFFFFFKGDEINQHHFPFLEAKRDRNCIVQAHLISAFIF